jgi:hypothetical protein
MLIRHNKTAKVYSLLQAHIQRTITYNELKKYYDITFSVKMIQNFNNIWGHGNKLRLTRYHTIIM